MCVSGVINTQNYRLNHALHLPTFKRMTIGTVHCKKKTPLKTPQNAEVRFKVSKLTALPNYFSLCNLYKSIKYLKVVEITSFLLY